MKRKPVMKRKLVIATIAAAVLAGGVATTAVAVDDDTTERARQQVTTALQDDDGRDDRDDDGGKDDRDDDGGKDDRDDDGNDAAEDASLVREAKVTATDAIAAALKAVPGTVTEAGLDDDRKAVTWDVEVLDKNGKDHNVTVDAKTGKVVEQHADDERG